MNTSIPGDRGPFLNGRKAVGERYGKSSKWVQRAEQNPDLGFPTPININGHLCWSLPELIAWERTLPTVAVKRGPKKRTPDAPRPSRHQMPAR